MAGLNTDTPAQALDHTAFSAGTNMRPFDGSLQSVFKFDNNTTNANNIEGDTENSNKRTGITKLVSWIETGSNELRLAYIWFGVNDPDNAPETTSYNVQIINDLTSNSSINGVTASTMMVPNARWGQQLLAFNGILVVNDGTQQPIFVAEGDNGYIAQFIAGWLSSPYDNLSAADQALIDAATADNPVTNADLASTEVWNEGENGWSSRTQFEQLNQALTSTRVTCERIIAYNNRLIVLNINGDYLGDTLGNASIVWSTPIDELGSLNNVTFRFSSTNSAGDDILTETPGEVIDGGACGQYLIIYKDDAVYRYIDTGTPLFLVGEPIYVDDGLFSPDCFVDIGGGRHVMLGNYGVYVHDGGPNRQNVSRGRVQDTLYSDIDTSSIARKSETFLFHHENDNEVWVCIPLASGTSGCQKAYIYNYDQDTWYTRDLPDVTDISLFQKDGVMYIFGVSASNVWELYNERDSVSDKTKYESGSIELHYLGFGDHSKVKHLLAVYPHCMGDVDITIDTSNNVGQDPTFPEPARTFDGGSEFYKLDYREHGRFYHIRVQGSNVADMDPNPEMTSMGFNMKIGGDR